MNDNDPKIEVSPLSRRVTRNGITVEVQIYRIVGEAEEWSLEVVDEEDGSTVWEGSFATDQDAYQEFLRTLDEEGIFAFFPASGPH